MESNRSEPMIITSSLNESFTDQCSFDDNCGEWQDLEQFWGEEKLRLQDVDGQRKLSSSLEEHLLYDNFLNEPTLTNQNSNVEELESKIVKGQDIADIPTAYTAEGFKTKELIVIGTYVDKNILPGFQYKVRKNLANEYFFDGKAKYLDSIGLGYGKRITFEGATLNENENYFWSDSCIHGYGFTLQTISEEDNYNIFDTNTGKVIGRIFINNPSLTDDTVLSTAVGEWGYIKKEVEVLFSCDVILNDSANHQNIYVEDVPVRGKAIAVRENWSSKAKVNQIFLHDFLINNCLLLPEE